MIYGYCSGVLVGMGFGFEEIVDFNLNFCDISLCVYGWYGLWVGWCGFDFLV